MKKHLNGVWRFIKTPSTLLLVLSIIGGGYLGLLFAAWGNADVVEESYRTSNSILSAMMMSMFGCAAYFVLTSIFLVLATDDDYRLSRKAFISDSLFFSPETCRDLAEEGYEDLPYTWRNFYSLFFRGALIALYLLLRLIGTRGLIPRGQSTSYFTSLRGKGTI